MDQKTLQTPPKIIPTVGSENKINTLDQNTPPPMGNSGKTSTPDQLKVPKAFKYPERYTSPTDQMMSPVSRGILARCRKGSKLLPPSTNMPQIQALQLQESGVLQSEKVLKI